jgi:hypothetical protein
VPVGLHGLSQFPDQCLPLPNLSLITLCPLSDTIGGVLRQAYVSRLGPLLRINLELCEATVRLD